MRPDPPVRRDRRGRRIGHNWWREYNCSILLDATLVWEAAAEAEAIGYDTEIAAYAENHPRPTLKNFLLANAGMNTQREGTP